MLLWALVSSAVLAPLHSDVGKAERYYDQAKYEKALRSLGPSCEGATEVMACERLRGFIHVALGQELAARAAFDRLLAKNPLAILRDTVSPKIKAIFKQEKQLVQDTRDLTILPVPELPSMGLYPVQVKGPAFPKVQRVVAHVSIQNGTFSDMPLQYKNGTWVGTIELQTGQSLSDVHYYLVSTLASGLPLLSGTPDQPHKLVVQKASTLASNKETQGRQPVAEGSLNAHELLHQGVEDNDARQTQDEEEGFPAWAKWTLLSTGAAALVAGTVLGIIWLTKDDTGDLHVKVVVH